MLNTTLIIFGKLLLFFFRRLNLGNGSTWPGHIALSVKQNFIKEMLRSNPGTKIIVVAGTNGKTTTSSLVATVLKDNGKKTIQNISGANLLNGIASALILSSSVRGKIGADYAILEIDENNLPLILNEVTPDYLILLNLFRDQLDRYGEVNTIAENWKTPIVNLTKNTTLILNADDPQIAYLGKNTNANTLYFCYHDSNHSSEIVRQAADSTYCPNCKSKLIYKEINFSHLGDWNCTNCGLSRPKPDLSKFPTYPLPGTYNKYNTLAAVITLKKIGLAENEIIKSLESFKPSFGRQEILEYKNKKIQIFLSKNPTSFNQSFRTISDMEAKNLLVILNDRIPDGRDISWIWDFDIPNIEKFQRITISGDRVYDMALRFKYELGIVHYESKIKTYENLKRAIDEGVNMLKENETLHILPTYSAMLDVRKILTGKKIL